MFKYIFITGHNQSLSIAEIIYRFRPSSYLSLSDQAILINLDNPIEDPVKWQNLLGGTIKITQLLKESPDIHQIKSVIESFLPARDIGLSFYHTKNFPTRKIIQLKQRLKSEGLPKRFVFNRDLSPLNAATLKKNKLLTKGTELCTISSGQRYFFAQTLSFQDVDNYTLRDYGKPKPDPKAGMLPPKLAQIMISLADLSPDSTIYDPFCGSGTILQEALLQNLKIIGSDISEKAIVQTRENLKWLVKQFSIDLPDYRQQIERLIYMADATTNKLKQPVDAIIVEPYLGPPLRSLPPAARLTAIKLELIELYQEFLQNSYDNLKPNGRLIMVLPIWQSDPIVEIDVTDLLDQTLARQYNQICPDNLDLVYQQPTQRVHRRILILEKIKS